MPAKPAAGSELQRLRLLYLRQGPYAVEHIRWQFAVDLDQRDGIAARRFAADVEGRDIDAGVAHGRRELADEARLVAIGDVDHRGAELRIHADALDVDDARTPIGEHGSGYSARPALGLHRDGDQTFIIAMSLARHLLDHDAALLCDERG